MSKPDRSGSNRSSGLVSGHGGTEYEMLLDGYEMVAHLHQWEADEQFWKARSSAKIRDV